MGRRVGSSILAHSDQDGRTAASSASSRLSWRAELPTFSEGWAREFHKTADSFGSVSVGRRKSNLQASVQAARPFPESSDCRYAGTAHMPSVCSAAVFIRLRRHVEAAAASEEARFLCLDKIFTMRQHREEALAAVARGVAARAEATCKRGRSGADAGLAPWRARIRSAQRSKGGIGRTRDVMRMRVPTSS